MMVRYNCRLCHRNQGPTDSCKQWSTESRIELHAEVHAGGSVTRLRCYRVDGVQRGCG